MAGSPGNISPSSNPISLQAGEFRDLLAKQCGVSLELDEAWRRASQLIALYRILMGPIPEDPGVQTSER